ncbi:calcium-binding protein [Ensifer sp. T173]|uniref:Calcium-binding protein n=1 Tax=Ensifer canadensis TaxID=555315 RepID=A0AAW4FH59_9HYPH|nr:cadherin-like domain-containing protein [Ensifer canadensis]MBM3090339.1 calcium-binding protein [Ensifer canadensis]UBI80281.1 cadherin-like domain-containing protein [Ensifer canadensis]
MIEAKGTKTVKEEDPHQRYSLKNEEAPSRAPAVIAMFLTGFALYLKSAFSTASEPAEEQPPQAREPQEDMAPLQLVAENKPEEVKEEEAPAKKKAGGAMRNYSSQNEEMDAVDIRSPSFRPDDFSTSMSERWELESPSPVLRASNDNVASAPSVAGSPVKSFPVKDGEDDKPGGGDDDDDDDDNEDNDPVNRAPRVNGSVTLKDASGCAAVVIGLSDLLRGASDPDGNLLSVRDITVTSGTITRTAEGWLYDWTELGPVTITYQITDGQLSITQTAYFSVVSAPPIVGTLGDDLLLGTNCSDAIDGRAGDDSIDARGGADTVDGGDGNDNIVAGGGNDIIFAGIGNDVVFGGTGDDQIHGGSGNDRLFGEEGRDILSGDEGDDALHGGADDDLAFGGDGNDLVAGDEGNDAIDGGSGDDRLSGGSGNDTLLGQAGKDHLVGDEGADVLVGGGDEDIVMGGAGNDTIAGEGDLVSDQYDGGDGLDTLDYSSVSQSIIIDLGEGNAAGEEIGEDTISNFEVVLTGQGDDSVTASLGAETIATGAGDDTVKDAGGDLLPDLYDGGDGTDTLDYSSLSRSIEIDLSEGQASGAEIGEDTVANFEVVLTGQGDDSVIGSDNAETIVTGAGNDTIHDGAGADVVSAGAGNDTVMAAADSADDHYDGQSGLDTLDYSAATQGVVIDLETGIATGVDIGTDIVTSFEQIVGSAQADVFHVGQTALILEGGSGDDVFRFNMPAGSSTSDAIHHILDFMVGDRIEMSRYQIFEEIVDNLEDHFEAVYGEDVDEDALPIRMRHEGTEEHGVTRIEFDTNNDQEYEVAVTLSGHHMLVVVETAQI